MRNKPFHIVVLFLFFFGIEQNLNAQNSEYSFIEEIIENILQSSESEEYDFDTYFETFTYYSKNPINLNKTNSEELHELLFLSDNQITQFFQYLKQERKIINIYELQAIPSFDLNTIYNLLPFVRVSGEIEDFHVPFKKLLFKGQHQVFFRYSQQFPNKEGFNKDKITNSSFLGDPTKLYLRYKYDFGNKISYGLTAEKDAGEEFFKGVNKGGFDFYSAHLFFRTNSIFKKVALGDYQLKLGQGLLVWTGFGTSKSSYTMNVKKTGSSIKPYTSADEYRFFRGAATQIVIKKFEITPFVSIKQVDANISYVTLVDTLDTTADDIETLSLQTFGMHRNKSEIENKNQLLEVKFGAGAKYGKNDRHIGLNFIHTLYDKEIKTALKPYNKFKAVGKSYTNASVDYSYIIKTFHFFGENAFSFTQNENSKFGYGLLNGVLFSADKRVDFSLVHRYYDKKFTTGVTTNAFAESSTPNNEHGLYLGTEIRPLKYLIFNAYADVYQFPWLKFQANIPSFGTDFLAQLKYIPNKQFEIYFRYKNERKLENTKIKFLDGSAEVDKQNRHYFLDYFGDELEFSTDDFGRQMIQANPSVTKEALDNARFLSFHSLQSFRLNAKFKASKAWSFQSRADFTIYNDEINGVKYGFMVFQDVSFKALSFPMSFNLRLAYFDVQDYGARIYTYESDVLYQFSVPAFNNRGFRTYLNLRYRIYKGIDLWVKVSNTHYTNLSTISSGPNTVKGNNLTELKAQIRFQF